MAKTLKVLDLIIYVNSQLSRTDEYMTSQIREGLCVVLEHVLTKTNNYQGFNYLYWIEGGCDEWRKDGQIETHPEKNKYIYGEIGSKYNGCQFARKYYINSKLQNKK